MSPGSRVDHNTFCATEGWATVRDARGRTVRHHVTYELPVPDGRVLRTRISRPVNTTTYGPRLWSMILRDQLDVTENEFWACVRNELTPDRGHATIAVPEGALPAQLVWQLVHQAGVPEDAVMRMTLKEAVVAMTAYWSTPQS